MGNKLNLKGQTFGRLVAIKDLKKRESGNVVWLCRCDCGNLVEVRVGYLRNGQTKSCGCLQKELMSKMASKYKGKDNPRYKHGESGNYNRDSKLYQAWANMKQRCYYSRAINYHWYGKRGIRVYDEWKDYVAFKTWALANGYKKGLTIDRVDNNGNYRPENCQWLTKSENLKKAWRDR